MSTGENMQFSVRGFTGTDMFASIFYSHRMMAKRVAKKMLRDGGPWCDSEPSGKCLLILNMPDRAYRIVDTKGNIEPWDGPVQNVGL